MLGNLQAAALPAWRGGRLPLTLVMTTTAPNETVTIPCYNSGTFNAVIDWGDGSTSEITTYDDADLAHVYANAGDQTITIRGQFPNIYFFNGGDKLKLKAVRHGEAHIFRTISNAFMGCTNLTELSGLDITGVSSLQNSFYNTNITSFPIIKPVKAATFSYAWRSGKFTTFPFLSAPLYRSFREAWRLCAVLQDFPANFFDYNSGFTNDYCFYGVFESCIALTAQSVENILVSIATSGRSAPATGPDITIDYNVATGALTGATTSAITTLKSRGWTVTINGVAQ